MFSHFRVFVFSHFRVFALSSFVFSNFSRFGVSRCKIGQFSSFSESEQGDNSTRRTATIVMDAATSTANGRCPLVFFPGVFLTKLSIVHLHLPSWIVRYSDTLHEGPSRSIVIGTKR